MTAKTPVRTAAKPATGAKPAPAKSTARAARTTTAKSTAPAKSAKTSSKHTQAKKTAAKRGLARAGDLLPACAAEAVAMSLRLAGQRVSDDEVSELHWLAGGDVRRPVSIPEALAAAARSGLAGCRPVLAERPAQILGGDRLQVQRDLGIGQLGDALHGIRSDSSPIGEAAYVDRPVGVHALILGVSVPGPHCVLATADGWWSWGQLYSPWPCAIEEWAAVTWS